MTWTWHAVEQDVRLRHAEALRRAALDRLVGEARRAGRTRRGPGRARRFLHRLGGWLVIWGARLQAPGVATIRAHTAYQPHPRIAEMPGGPATAATWPDAT